VFSDALPHEPGASDLGNCGDNEKNDRTDHSHAGIVRSGR
jgi:hypothetical protein